MALSPLSDRKVQLKPLAESFSLSYKQRGDGNDNGVVEPWEPCIYICRKNHLFEKEVSAKSHYEILNQKNTTSGLQRSGPENTHENILEK